MLRQYEVPQCPICFDELTTNLAATKCGHVFHRQCIEKALSRNPQCPLDRVVNSVDSLRGLAYSIGFQVNSDVDNFFKEIPDDQKRSIEKLSLKLQSVLQEKSKLALKCTGLIQQNTDYQDQLQKLDNKIQDDQKTMNSQKNQISTLNSKVEYKQCQLEDIERDKANIVKEKEKLECTVQQLTNLNEVAQLMENFEKEAEQRGQESQIVSSAGVSSVSSTARGIDWAKQMRRANSIQQQADLFYEAYRVILVKQDSYKAQIEKLRQDNESLQQYKHCADSDLRSMNKKCQTLIDKNKSLRKLLENATKSQEEKSLSPKSSNNSNQLDNRPTKKRKLDEIDNIVKLREPEDQKLENTQKEFQSLGKQLQPVASEKKPEPAKNPFSKQNLEEANAKSAMLFRKSQNLAHTNKSSFQLRQGIPMAGSFLNSSSMLNNKGFYKDQLKQKKIDQQKQAAKSAQSAKQPGINNFFAR